MANKRLSGEVKKYIPLNIETKKGGFGFINGDDGEEYFFNIKNCQVLERALSQGFRVNFTPTVGIDRIKQAPSNQATGVDAA